MSREVSWLRLYSRIVDDEKLRLLAFEDRWHFVALLCLKNEGLIDEPDSDLRQRKIAVRLGVQVRELDEIARRLCEVGLIDEELNPLAWDSLQFVSDASTERVRKFREKQRLAKEKRCTKRKGNVSVTVQEAETETDIIEPNGSCASDDALKPEHFVESWNALASASGLRTIRSLTPERRSRLKARINGYTVEDFREVLANIRGSPFLLGERGWKGCTFDWVTKKQNFQKILEGNYNG